ncbi:Chromatin structure-remodeling complex subunit RSC4 [Nakaseomyces glabratus]|uniref:Chromatin structure-remodeling complex subunit RSC4 n=1 Tax=Candida glabrata TaxID=5478 RepID=A0A0W0DL60_CANGB|nr:Bromodomain [Nakaseomyces glabratus]KAH7583515.1 Bromodomain [Nakaseomyces glabratus]KAI8383348.1 Bromodomain [Nakaseomyces glabratus]KAI8392733.1 Bromodomain [Nakaseomyces glabratus]KTB01116.1 Chromatin structure-remodeling complex subunit RSC4 [Nakaseomyces glabratus]
MVFKKRKIEEEEEHETDTKYTPGKHPRTQASLPRVDYESPLDPENELFLEEWNIPKINNYISYMLDTLIETHKNLVKDFIKLPSRKFHPQYYYKIEKPISINEIKSRDYETNDGNLAFLLDVELIAKNCVSYNEEDTLIVKNSEQVVNLIEAEVLKTKNMNRNYLLNDSLKKRATKYLDLLLDCTDKDIEEAFNRPTKGVDSKMKICEPFREMVNKDDLPEYYEIIQNPISLDVIATNITIGKYKQLYDFITDVQLVFLNARVYNDVNTLIYQDATRILHYFNYLINNKLFAELQDATERGELNLELDPVGYEHMINEPSSNTNSLNLLDNDDMGETDNLEGLGNGYNRSIMSEDFLLGPMNDRNESNNNEDEEDDAEAKVPKYNIIKSLQKDVISNQYTMAKKPFEIIKQIEIFSTLRSFKQAVDPLPGSKPSTNPDWFQYIFKGNQMSQNENMYSLSLQPIHTQVTIAADTTKSGIKISLVLNRMLVKSRKMIINERNLMHLQSEVKPDLSGLVGEREEFDIRLSEGLNMLELRCIDTAQSQEEVVKLWINIFA